MAEKSRDLAIEARKEMIQANVLRSKASEVAEQRLLVSLRTANSAMTSTDVRAVLSRMNSTEQTLSLFDSMLAKRSLYVQVQRLEDLGKETWEKSTRIVMRETRCSFKRFH